jgi:WD40 repeat protein
MSISGDSQIKKTIAIFQHSAPTMCVTFSVDGKHILSGGGDKMISEWVVPEDDNSQILIDDTAACGECIAKGIVPLLEEFTETEIHRPVQVTQPSSVRSNHPPRRTPNA